MALTSRAAEVKNVRGVQYDPKVYPKAGQHTVVKLQRPIVGTGHDLLMYNKDRFIYVLVPPEKKFLDLFPKDSFKIYLAATLVPDLENPGKYKVSLNSRVVDRNW